MQPPDLPGLDHVRLIGSGGFADVHLYDQRLPRRLVAVKVLRQGAGSPSAAAAFMAEANAMARLDHPWIVAVHSVGIAPDDRPYLVMPYYPGPSLSERAATAPLALDETLRLGVQLAGALETAHRHGVLHRDVKPGNVLTNAYGTPGLTDFGLAGAATDPDADDAGVSVPFAPPEVLFGTASATAASDLYSLAATLWTLLAGQSPFEAAPGESQLALAGRIRADPVPALARAGVPETLEALLRRGLAKDPRRRPGSARAFGEELRTIESALGLPSTDLVVGGPCPSVPLVEASPEVARGSGLLGDPAPPVTLRPQGAGRTVSPRRRPRRAALGIAAALLVVLAVVLAWQTGRPAPAGPAVTIVSTRAGGVVSFTWTYLGQRGNDRFNVAVGDRVAQLSSARLDVSSAAPVCVRVQVLDAAGAAQGDFSAPECSS